MTHDLDAGLARAPCADAPIPVRERIRAMDVIRGFALLGIALMNIEGMAGPLNDALTGLDPTLAGADRLADALVYIFVQGKFYALFSLLFGMGFAVMMARAQDAGRPFVRLYLRRSFALLAIGLVHAVLVWSGDILTSYALISLLLIAVFANVSTYWLPWLGVGLYLVPSVLNLGLGAIGSLAQLEPNVASEFNKAMADTASAWAEATQAQRVAYGGGSYVEATLQRLRDFGSMMTFLVFVGWQVLGLFVLGMWFVRSGAIARPQEHARLYARLRWIGLPAGLALMWCAFALVPTQDMGRLDVVVGLATSLGAVASLLMALGYMAWIVRGMQSPVAARPLALLAPAGRMALTNYLMQSLVCTLVFYGYGLGMFEQLPRAWQPAFVLVLFVVQVALSHAWLARFRFGPMEWLWRTLTYGQRQPMRV